MITTILAVLVAVFCLMALIVLLDGLRLIAIKRYERITGMRVIVRRGVRRQQRKRW